MDIAPVEVLIQDHVQNVGDTFPVKGHVDVSSYSLGDRDFTLANGFDYDLLLTNTGEGILVTGILRGKGTGVCDRCLNDAHFDISSDIEEYYRFEDVPKEDEETEGEKDFGVCTREGKINLTDALIAGLYAETPFVLLCQTDCKGLCPHCGVNLNVEKCACNEQSFENEDANPFAKLAQLKDQLDS